MPSQLQIKKKIKNKDIMIGLHDMQTNHIFLIFLQIKYECILRQIIAQWIVNIFIQKTSNYEYQRK